MFCSFSDNILIILSRHVVSREHILSQHNGSILQLKVRDIYELHHIINNPFTSTYSFLVGYRSTLHHNFTALLFHKEWSFPLAWSSLFRDKFYIRSQDLSFNHYLLKACL